MRSFAECPLDGAACSGMNLSTGLAPLAPMSVFTDLAVEVTESMCVSSLRPAVRALPSRQMFEHMLKRHNVLFVYVGGESPLKVSATYRLFSWQCHRRRLLLLLNEPTC